MNLIKHILTCKQRKSLRTQLNAVRKDYTQARKRYENAIERKCTQLQHDAGRDVQAALHERLRIENELKLLNASLKQVVSHG